MIAKPFTDYELTGRKSIGDNSGGKVGQFIGWPSTGAIFVYSNYGPTATQLGAYQAGIGPGGSIGVITGIVTDGDGGSWYQVDTSGSPLPAVGLWPNATSNTIFIPTFGDTSDPSYIDYQNNLSSGSYTAQSNGGLTFTNTSGGTTNPAPSGGSGTSPNLKPGSGGGSGTSPGGGLGFWNSPFAGPFTGGETTILSLFLVGLAAAVIYNTATKK